MSGKQAAGSEKQETMKTINGKQEAGNRKQEAISGKGFLLPSPRSLLLAPRSFFLILAA
jgi:hypothetical protein